MSGSVASTSPLGSSILRSPPPRDLPRRGRVEFIRFIRSVRLLKILDAKITVPEELVHRYVTATLHLRTRRLVVEAHGHFFRMELPFRVKA